MEPPDERAARLGPRRDRARACTVSPSTHVSARHTRPSCSTHALAVERADQARRHEPARARCAVTASRSRLTVGAEHRVQPLQHRDRRAARRDDVRRVDQPARERLDVCSARQPHAAATASAVIGVHLVGGASGVRGRLDLEQLDVEHEHALRPARRDPCTRAPRGSRTGTCRRPTSA